MSNAYIHRNGEKELPTEAGYYWFLEEGHRFVVYEFEPVNETRFRLDGDEYDSRVWVGRWWGPLIVPQETTP